jgi:hypothetical protein
MLALLVVLAKLFAVQAFQLHHRLDWGFASDARVKAWLCLSLFMRP